MPNGMYLRKVRTKTGDTDDANPNTTAPGSGDIMELGRFVDGTRTSTHGMRGKLELNAASKTADIEFWVRNEETDDGDTWGLAGTLVAVGDNVMFEHLGLGDAATFMRLTNITSGGSPIQVWAVEA